MYSQLSLICLFSCQMTRLRNHCLKLVKLSCHDPPTAKLWSYVQRIYLSSLKHLKHRKSAINITMKTNAWLKRKCHLRHHVQHYSKRPECCRIWAVSLPRLGRVVKDGTQSPGKRASTPAYFNIRSILLNSDVKTVCPPHPAPFQPFWNIESKLNRCVAYSSSQHLSTERKLQQMFNFARG